MDVFKNTNSYFICSILSTFLLLSLVSCKPTVRVSSSDIKDNKTSKETKTPTNSAATKVNKVITTARSYKGTHYKYGGSSRNGMDCSGLTYTAFKSINIELPRTADEQSHKIKQVKLEELKPGDLVFFTDKKGHKKINHVGIVTEVKGPKNIKFIHASTKAGVIEESLNTEWYLSIFIKAGRIL